MKCFYTAPKLTPIPPDDASEHQTFLAALIGTAGEPCEVCGGFGRSPFRS